MEPPIKIVFCIVKKEKTKEAIDILNEMGACAIYAFSARGVGHSGFLKVMGLEDLEVDLLVCPVKGNMSAEIIVELSERLSLKEKNHGLVFSIKLGAISKNALYGLLNMGKETEMIIGQSKNETQTNEMKEISKTEEQNSVEVKEDV